MNRELKFRVWDTFHKQWIGACAIELDGTIIDIHNAIPDNNWIAQQYTGLTDSKGNEIYEGDIICGDFDSGPAGFIKQKLPICWHNEFGYQWNYWNLSTIEVVGNIFETPNLLK